VTSEIPNKIEHKGNSLFRRKKSRVRAKQVQEINKSLNLLSAYGEFDKFLLVAK
jgi:hypothetical protein